MKTIKTITTQWGTVNSDGSFIDPNGKLHSKELMTGYVNQCRGMNRIHKPMGLLFYTDVMNGKAKNWLTSPKTL